MVEGFFGAVTGKFVRLRPTYQAQFDFECPVCMHNVLLCSVWLFRCAGVAGVVYDVDNIPIRQAGQTATLAALYATP